MIRSLKIDLINLCNAACSFCPYHGTEGSVTDRLRARRQPLSWLTVSDIEMLAQGCARLGITPKFRFSGQGEATVHPDFQDIMQLIHSRGFPTRLITNGLLLERHAVLLASCRCEVVVSIHGTEATHDAVIGKTGALRRAESGIRAFSAQGARADISVILTPENIEDLEGIVARYAYQGLAVRMSHNFDPKVRAALSADSVHAALGRVRATFPEMRTIPDIPVGGLAAYYGTRACVLHPYRCTQHAEALDIRSDGTVVGCDGVPFGSIRDTALEDIMYGRQRVAFLGMVREELASPHGLAPDRCDRCCHN
jgi:MoaA/NifB/PqqE/SkfB family radical SAM enzyme